MPFITEDGVWALGICNITGCMASNKNVSITDLQWKNLVDQLSSYDVLSLTLDFVVMLTGLTTFEQ